MSTIVTGCSTSADTSDENSSSEAETAEDTGDASDEGDAVTGNDSESWDYFQNLYDQYFLVYSYDPTATVEFIEDDRFASVPEKDKELLTAAFSGIINWLDNKGDYDVTYFSNVVYLFHPFNTEFSANITF